MLHSSAALVFCTHATFGLQSLEGTEFSSGLYSFHIPSEKQWECSRSNGMLCPMIFRRTALCSVLVVGAHHSIAKTMEQCAQHTAIAILQLLQSAEVQSTRVMQHIQLAFRSIVQCAMCIYPQILPLAPWPNPLDLQTHVFLPEFEENLFFQIVAHSLCERRAPIAHRRHCKVLFYVESFTL